MFLFNIIVYNIILLYGTVGEIITEKAGSLNLGVEGTMAVGAISGYLMGCYTNSMLVGVLFSVISAGLCGLLFAFLTVTLQANQNVTGLTISTFGVGLYFFIGKGFGENFPVISDYPAIKAGAGQIHIPFLSDIPVIGKVIFSQNILVYLGIAIALLAWAYLKYTKAGLCVRSIGENPAAADSMGVNITLYKYIHLVIGSAIMGIGGYYMGLVMGGSFEGSNCWTGGYGWIAIALVIFASWNPAKAILGTIIFGFFNTLQIYSGSLADAFPGFLGWLRDVPAQFYSALPFLITAIVLVVESMRKKKNKNEPSAIGVNYYREDR
ncbi:MAG: ABC transporter permease [Clostridiales bacterium]|nr:MAG: ABC transporter permease [Clostridiales bacterium]